MLLVSLLLVHAQGPKPVPVITGRVVAELDGVPIEGATLAARDGRFSVPTLTTDALGAFTFDVTGTSALLREHPKQRARSLDDGLVQITAPGRAAITWFSDSHAPWTNTIPLLPSATLRGSVTDAGPGQTVRVIVPAEAVVWPPQTGLALSDVVLQSPVAEDGSFAIDGIPAHTSIHVQWISPRTRGEPTPLPDLVLVAGEQRAIHIDGSMEARVEPTQPAQDSPTWYSVSCTPIRAGPNDVGVAPVPALDAWLDVTPNSRHVSHSHIAGGRWHVHGQGPCNHIEALPGPKVLVARTPDGSIGMTRFTVPQDPAVSTRVEVRPGGLLRLQVDPTIERAVVTLRCQEIEFVARDVSANTVWYELAPAGDVLMQTAIPGQEPIKRKLSVVAGTIQRVAIDAR